MPEALSNETARCLTFNRVPCGAVPGTSKKTLSTLDCEIPVDPSARMFARLFGVEVGDN